MVEEESKSVPEEEDGEQEPTVDDLLKACSKLFVDPETGEKIMLDLIDIEVGKTLTDYEEFKSFMQKTFPPDDPNSFFYALGYVRAVIETNENRLNMDPDELMIELENAGILEPPEPETEE